MAEWTEPLRIDPIPALLASEHQPIRYFSRRDLVLEEPGPIDTLWALPAIQGILRKQQQDGSWRYTGRNRQIRPEINYDLLETFRQLAILIDKYGFDLRHPAIENAAGYLFACQTETGDIRGILGTQYMPYYHGAILEILIKAGYASDSRVERGLEWLLSVRQDDGGWIIPMQAVPPNEKTREVWSAPPVPPDRSRPFSHLATGMALRPFALHPDYRRMEAVVAAAQLLKSRFLKSDKYNDRKASRYWLKFQYPFWWTNLLTGLDTLSLLGFDPGGSDVQRALEWFVDNQQEDGLWKTSYEQFRHSRLSAREREAMQWVSLAICRVFQRFNAWQTHRQQEPTNP